jgi:MFS transporter, DHA1 family, inner membrane transport protein
LQADGRRLNENALLAVLTAIQFVHILDFVIIMPLGPQLMRSLDISAHQFGLLVSAYTFAAAATGLLAAVALDRVDRKRGLLWLLAGFGVGTLLCGLATSYPLLLAARAAAGACGGVLAAVVLAVIGDQVPMERRGRATGIVMAGFSVASVLGLPAGLSLASRWGWQSPFIALAGATALVLVVGIRVLPQMRGHLGPVGADRGPTVQRLVAVAREPVHVRAFVFTIALMLAGFSVIPFLSPYLVTNAGLPEGQLYLIYLVGGLFTAFTSPMFGRWADRWGAEQVFVRVALVSVIPVVGVTLLPPLPVPAIIAITTVFMVVAGGRWVTALSLINNAVEARTRGSFMSLNSSVQQLGAGLASLLAGWMVVDGPDRRLHGYPKVGIFAAVCVFGAVVLARRLGAMAPSASAYDRSGSRPEPQGAGS